jgi:signal transduction histidine kinase
VSPVSDHTAVRGRLDGEGRLIEADAKLAALHARAGGEEGGLLAVPPVAALARLAARLNIVVERAALVADGDHDLDLWVRAEPGVDAVALTLTGWAERPARTSAVFPADLREADFLRAAADWTWETDDALRFTSVSAGTAAAIGKSAIELRGKQLTKLFRFLETEDGSLPILSALAEQRRFDDQLAELRGAARARYRLDGVPLIDGSGRFAGFRGHATSVQAELDSRPADSHEGPAFGDRLDQALRTPLDKIIANAETISAQPDGPLSKDYASYAVDIATAGRHLLALVDDLVDLQAIERPDFRPEFETLDLADVARRAAGLLAVRASGRNVRMDRPGDDENVLAVGEFRRALQILVNLLTNAIRYSPEGGMIWIRIEREGDVASVVIADQGKGIAEDDQTRIFDKFERVDPAEPGGTGLGLYIARRLARAMGGEIAVESAPGQGARFRFTLPAPERAT